MTQTNTHTVELLQADIRKWRQALRILANKVIAGDSDSVAAATAALALLHTQEQSSGE